MGNMNKIMKKKIVTHSGNFHTDEVFACAVLSLVHNDEVEIVRSRDPEVWATGDYVVDVGGEYDSARGRFDHHQIGGAGKRENGIPYSSFGLVWKEYGEKLCGGTYQSYYIDEKLVQPVDTADNGINTFDLNEKNIFPYLLHHVVTAFRPTWREEAQQEMSFDEGFAQSVGVAKQILLREMVIAKDEFEGETSVVDLYHKSADKRIIVVDGQYPWERALSQFPEPLYVVKPDHENGGKWKVKTVRGNIDSFESRKPFPSVWAGKSGKELAEITGVPDAIFCHTKLFIAVAGSKEGALKLAQRAVDAK